MRRRLPAVLAAGLLAAGCSSAHQAVSGSSDSSDAAIAQEQLHPTAPGRLPDKSAQMICSTKLETATAKALGLSARISKPVWHDDLYSCDFVYPTGTITLSLKELGSTAATIAYFTQQKATLGNAGDVAALGQGAFQPPDGSMVVRKAWGVLTVGVAGLPSEFGIPPTPRADISYTVADLIVACWEGD
jgi:hypothetical protein